MFFTQINYPQQQEEVIWLIYFVDNVLKVLSSIAPASTKHIDVKQWLFHFETSEPHWLPSFTSKWQYSTAKNAVSKRIGHNMVRVNKKYFI